MAALACARIAVSRAGSSDMMRLRSVSLNRSQHSISDKVLPQPRQSPLEESRAQIFSQGVSIKPAPEGVNRICCAG
jgi:hypothetical protein